MKRSIMRVALLSASLWLLSFAPPAPAAVPVNNCVVKAGSTIVNCQASYSAGASFTNITSATTTVVKGTPGVLHKLMVNTLVGGATITLYNNTAGSGAKIATITLPGTITSDNPLEFIYDVGFSTGLTIVTSGATDITAVWR